MFDLNVAIWASLDLGLRPGFAKLCDLCPPQTPQVPSLEWGCLAGLFDGGDGGLECHVHGFPGWFGGPMGTVYCDFSKETITVVSTLPHPTLCRALGGAPHGPRACLAEDMRKAPAPHGA